MSEKQDIKIGCTEKDCTEVRIFTVRDQEFYAKKGFAPPKRCRTHSQQRRIMHQAREEENEEEQRQGWHDAPKKYPEEGYRN